MRHLMVPADRAPFAFSSSGRRALAGIGATLGLSLAVLATLPGQAGCADEAPRSSAEPPVIIGVSLGLTNGLSAFAGPIRDAVRVAEGQINAAGGVLGRRVLFDVRDDESDEERGVVEGVATSLVEAGAVAVIGPLGSEQVLRTQAIYAAANVVQISPSATAVELATSQPNDDRWFFRTTPADELQGAAVIRFAEIGPAGFDGGGGHDGGASPGPCARLAVVHLDNAYGSSMADVVERRFPERSGGRVVLRERIPVADGTDYGPLLGRLFGLPEPAQCMALIAYDDVGTRFLAALEAHARWPALEAAGFFVIGTDGMYTDGFLFNGRRDPADPRSENVAVGVYGTNPDTQSGTKAYNEFRTIYASYFPLAQADAPPFTANAFDAAVLVALAVQRAGTTEDRRAIRDALRTVSSPPGAPFSPAQLGLALRAARDGRELDYEGASGNVDLEASGNVRGGFIVWQVRRGAEGTPGFVTVARFTEGDLGGGP